MPTAQKFHSLGRGNGFPFCVPILAVADFTHWTTLGGLKKGEGAASESQRNASFEVARKMFWQSNGFVGDFSDSRLGLSETEVTIPLVPMRRVCPFSGVGNHIITRGDRESQDEYSALVSLEVDIQVWRFHDVSDASAATEDNFVGYGLYGGTGNYGMANTNRTFSAFVGGAFLDPEFNWPKALVKASGAIDADSLNIIPGTQTDPADKDIAYATLDGIPWVVAAEKTPDSDFPDIPPGVVDAANFHARGNWVEADGVDGTVSEVKITGLNFYT